MRIVLYLVAIVLANVLTAALQPFSFVGFIVPAGTFLIGATFILRDLVQRNHGRKTAYITIGVAMVLSVTTSVLLGDGLSIVFASTVSFAIAETTDTEIFTRLKASLSKRVFFSGLVGGTLDSAVFVVLGLSPIGAGFLPWAAVPMAIVGQVVVKTVLQGIGAVALKGRE